MERDQYANNTAAHSRITWGAIFGGAFVAFVTMMLLNTFGLAVGLTGQEGVGTGFAIWAVIVALLALFAGGYAMSFLESNVRREHVMMQGVILWGVVVFGLLMLAVTGLQMGITAVLGTAGAVAGQVSPEQLTALGNQLGLTEQELQQLQAQAGEAVEGAPAAWWSLLAMIVSLAAVIGGAISGLKARPPVSGSGRMQQERPLRSTDRTAS